MTTPEPTPRRDGVRQVDVLRMPLRRKREIAVGLLRGKLRTRDLGLRRSPIIHGGVDIRMAHGVIEFGRFCEIHRRVVLAVGSGVADRPARLTIGDRTSIWYGTVLSARTEITIGANCAISWNCSIIDNDMHQVLDAEGESPESNGDREYVRIGDHVWVGAAAIILKGVTIGSNSVVAAGAVVTRDVPPNTLVAGVPARAVRHIGGWR